MAVRLWPMTSPHLMLPMNQPDEFYDLPPELRGKGYSILVTDAEGRDVYRAPIDTPSATPLSFLN
jgi:hypothetical protein